MAVACLVMSHRSLRQYVSYVCCVRYFRCVVAYVACVALGGNSALVVNHDAKKIIPSRNYWDQLLNVYRTSRAYWFSSESSFIPCFFCLMSPVTGHILSVGLILRHVIVREWLTLNAVLAKTASYKPIRVRYRNGTRKNKLQLLRVVLGSCSLYFCSFFCVFVYPFFPFFVFLNILLLFGGLTLVFLYTRATDQPQTKQLLLVYSYWNKIIVQN